MSKPFKFFPHETGETAKPPGERELKSFFDDQPVNISKPLESTPMPEEDLKEGLDLPTPPSSSAPEDAMIAELIRNHPNNIAKRR